MARDVYKVQRKYGQASEVYVELNNSNWRKPSGETCKQILMSLNKSLNIAQLITNPFTQVTYIKRTI